MQIHYLGTVIRAGLYNKHTDNSPEKFEIEVREVIAQYCTEPMAKAIDNGTSPPVLVEALLRSAYSALDLSAQNNR